MHRENSVHYKKFFKYNHFIESINDLSEKTKISIQLCIESYENIDIKKFNLLSNKLSMNEKIKGVGLFRPMI